MTFIEQLIEKAYDVDKVPTDRYSTDENVNISEIVKLCVSEVCKKAIDEFNLVEHCRGEGSYEVDFLRELQRQAEKYK